MPEDPANPDPAPILDLLEAFRRSKVMFAAVSLGIFDALAAGPRTPQSLAADLKAQPDALQRLLDASVCLDLLRRNGGQYENTLVAGTYLDMKRKEQAMPWRTSGGLAA